MKKKLSKELRMDFIRLSNCLSPENLACDGEISKSAGRKRYRLLMKEWARLCKLAGRYVSEAEVATFSRNY